MNSLRNRIALVLVGSLIVVVCLATLISVWFTVQNGGRNYVSSVARQLAALSKSADPLTGSVYAQKNPSTGTPDGRMTELLTEAMSELGSTRPVVFTRDKGPGLSAVSVEVAPGRWLLLRVPQKGPPRGAWLILGGWMTLILAGTIIVSLAVARRITRPLNLLEDYASKVGPNGELDQVPEIGPAEVRATARAINSLNHKLQLAIESRIRLVAAAGHDLRTPLTRMRLLAEFQEEGMRAKWLKNIDELERIAESAIVLVREETTSTDLEAVRLDRLAQSIADELASIDMPVRVVSSKPVTVLASRLGLTRALRNLMANAATHGMGAEVCVGQVNEFAVMTIDDRGPGIPDHLITQVFEPFFRVDRSRRQAVPGAGLGLAIAKQILGRMGGIIRLSNRHDGGLRQEISIKISQLNVAETMEGLVS